MKHRHRLLPVLLCAIMAAGCAGAIATVPNESPPMTPTRPDQIAVYPFATNPAEVTLNQSIIQKAYRNLSGETESTEQAKLAHEVAENICQQIVSDLEQKGWNAVCQHRGIPIPGNNVMIVDGDFTDVNEGNRLRRTIIGFGAGASTLSTTVQMYQRTGMATRQVLDFTTHADSGKMPGAIMFGPAGAAAGGSAAAVVGGNAAVGTAKGYRSSLGSLGQKTATQIIERLSQYFAHQGWTS